MDVKAELIVTGMFREGDPSLDPELVPNAVRELWKHFVEPELRERGGNEHPDGVRQALVEFLPDGQVRVLLDEEADFVALAGPAAKVLSPSDVFVEQITEVWPDGINPNAGWAGYVTAQGGRVLVCDFRRDLEASGRYSSGPRSSFVRSNYRLTGASWHRPLSISIRRPSSP
jgi:hypothetical protein